MRGWMCCSVVCWDSSVMVVMVVVPETHTRTGIRVRIVLLLLLANPTHSLSPIFPSRQWMNVLRWSSLSTLLGLPLRQSRWPFSSAHTYRTRTREWKRQSNRQAAAAAVFSAWLMKRETKEKTIQWMTVCAVAGAGQWLDSTPISHSCRIACVSGVIRKDRARKPASKRGKRVEARKVINFVCSLCCCCWG